MALPVKITEHVFYNGEVKAMSFFLMHACSPRSAIKIIRTKPTLVSYMHPVVRYWNKNSAKARRALEQTQKKVCFAYWTPDALKKLGINFFKPFTPNKLILIIDKFNLLSISLSKPRLDRLGAVRLFLHKSADEESEPKRPISLGFSVYLIAPSAPPTSS